MVSRLINSFISRLSVSRKLLLIYLLDLSAVIFITSILINEKFIAIDFARKELAGNHYIVAVREAQFAVAASRDAHGTRELATSAAPSAAVLRSAAAKITEAEAAYGSGMNTQDLAHSAASKTEHAALAGIGFQRTGADRVHREAFEAGLSLIRRIGDQSNLILDPDLDTYYTMSLVLLRYPELTDLVLQISDKAYDMLRGTASGPQALAEFLILEGKLAATIKGIESDADSAISSNPDRSLGAGLSAAQKRLLEALDGYVKTVRSQVRDNSAHGSSDGTLAAAHAATLEATHEAWAKAGEELDRMLHKRVDSLFLRMWVHLGTALVLLLAILYTVFHVARQIASPIQNLARVAERVTQDNDYTLRAQWSSTDEIGRLVDMFNTMLERLDKERLIQQELAATERATKAQRALLEAIPIPLAVTREGDHKLLHANRPAAELLGLCADAQPGASQVPLCYEEEDYKKFSEAIRARGMVDEFEARLVTVSGNRLWALVSARLLSYQGEAALLSTFTPINTLKQMAESLRHEQEFSRAALDSLPGIFFLTDRHSRLLIWNRNFEDVTGRSTDKLPQVPLERLFPAGSREAVRAAFDRALHKGAAELEAAFAQEDGSAVPYFLTARRFELAGATCLISVGVDLSERKAQEERIHYLAHHDPLTGLPNRSVCRDRLLLALERANRGGTRVAVLFIDLDRFKTINDSLGHHIGDGLLQALARRIASCTRGGDAVCRLGGDEFVVILSVRDETEVNQILEGRLLPQVRRPYDISGNEIHVTCSIGISLYPDNGSDVDTLLRNADSAMYQAKGQGRNTYQYFTEELNNRAFLRLNTENNLRRALDRGELALFYQPQMEAQSARLLGVEGLIRWLHPDLGLVPPGRFIPIAEESGLIVPIGEWVLREACRQHMAWRKAGLGSIRVAVNISALQFSQPRFADTVRAAIADTGINPERLELELTESIVMKDAEATIRTLQDLKRMRVRLSIDDFGTGYSSLSYLRRFPIDRLKIDQSFVRDMTKERADLAIVRAIIGLGHTLGLKVIAEGVETEEEYGVLRACGCDEVQGYHFARPMNAEDSAQWIRRRARADHLPGAWNA